MSEMYGDDGYDGTDEPDPARERGPATDSEFAALRRANTATKRAEAARDAALKEVAFFKAGIDPSAAGLSTYFYKGYDGDMTPDAIRAAATEAGLIQAPAPTPEQDAAAAAQQQALTAQERIAQASGSQMAAPTADQSAQAMLEEAFNKGGAEAMADVLQTMGVPRATI